MEFSLGNETFYFAQNLQNIHSQITGNQWKIIYVNTELHISQQRILVAHHKLRF